VIGAVICVVISSTLSRLAIRALSIMLPVISADRLRAAFEGSRITAISSPAVFGACGWIMKRLGCRVRLLVLGLVDRHDLERYLFHSTGELWRVGFIRVRRAVLFASSPDFIRAPAQIAEDFGENSPHSLEPARLGFRSLAAAAVVAVNP